MKHLSPFLLAALVTLLMIGCGARTELTTEFDADVGVDTDAPDTTDTDVPDVPPDVEPDVPPAELIVDCGRSRQFTTVRTPITLMVSVESDAPIIEGRWDVVDQPRGSDADVTPRRAETTTLVPDVLGEYVVEYSVEDAERRTASCRITVEAIVGPPRALCPEEELRVGIGEWLTVDGDGFDDFGVVDSVWEVREQPRGAADPDLREEGDFDVRFRARTPGSYVLQLTVIDEDGAEDSCTVEIYVTSPPELNCPEVIRAPTRQPVEIEVEVTDDTGIARQTWEMTGRPRTSEAELERTTGRRTRFTPDRQGNYTLLFTAVDDDGLSASCEIRVVGTPTPPTVMCPREIETPPLTSVEITGTAEDDGEIVSWAWRRVERPDGSAARRPDPANRPTTSFTPDIVGVYVLELTVTDDDRMTATCQTRVIAAATEGLRIEMFWDSDSTDMDTHLLNPGARRWYNDDDCYYANCTGGRLEWGDPGADDNPSLDIDDTDGFGPENINIDEPENGTYRVGVEAYSGAARQVTVRIYCGGSTTEPRATVGPVALSGGRGGRDDDFWRVADVEIRGGSCTVTELLRDGEPDVRPETSTTMSR